MLLQNGAYTICEVCVICLAGLGRRHFSFLVHNGYRDKGYALDDVLLFSFGISKPKRKGKKKILASVLWKEKSTAG